MQFVNWEARPAVLLDDGSAFAIPRGDRHWTRVNASEVVDSGGVVSLARFARFFAAADLSALRVAPLDPPTE